MPKISQLNPISQLTTSSILPVVDNGATQNVTLKRVVEFVSASIDVTFATEIELLQSASAITSSLNTFASASILSVNSKLSTSSFEAYTASVQTINTSSLVLTSSFNTFTSSYKSDSSSFDSRIDNLELINVVPFLSSSTFNSFTSSYTTHSSSIDGRLDVLEGISVTPFLSASTFNSYTSSNESTNTNQNSRLTSLENKTGSFATTGSNVFRGNQIISGSVSILIPGGTATGLNENSTPNNIFWSNESSVRDVQVGWIAEIQGGGTYTVTNVQLDVPFAPFVAVTLSDESLTLGYRVRINFSKNSKLWQFNNDGTLTGLPVGIISGSSQITNLGFATTSSVVNVNTSSLVTTSSFNTYTASISTASLVDRLNVIESVSGSWITENQTGSFALTANLPVVTPFLSSSTFNTFSASINTFTSSANTALGNVYTATSSLNTFTSSINTTIKSKLNTDGVISGSSQLPSGLISGSSQLPSGLVSGSSQVLNSSNILSSSVEGFSAFSSSVNSRINSAGGGSTDVSMFLSQSVFNTFATSSFMTFTASVNTFTSSANTALSNVYTATASLNSKTGSYATTGSNQFSGSQSITGSLTVTSLTTISSSISANSSSLYLGSGSNLYVQDNALVEITGSLKVRGVARFETVGGDEGGEIEFGVPQTNTTLSTRVVADIFQNRFRIFDGNTNGVYVDLSKAPTGVNGEITWKVSGYVNAGTFVQLDNVKVTIPTSGNRGASIGAVSTSFTANISATFGNSAGVGGNAANTVSYTTTASASAFGWNFGAAGDSATYILNDTTNSRVYRIITMIGTSYNNNFISIERLH